MGSRGSACIWRTDLGGGDWMESFGLTSKGNAMNVVIIMYPWDSRDPSLVLPDRFPPSSRQEE